MLCRLCVIMRYHVLAPPIGQVLAHAAVREDDQARLRRLTAQADPVLLLTDPCGTREFGAAARSGDKPVQRQSWSMSIRLTTSLNTAGGGPAAAQRTDVPTVGVRRYRNRPCSMDAGPDPGLARYLPLDVSFVRHFPKGDRSHLQSRQLLIPI